MFYHNVRLNKNQTTPLVTQHVTDLAAKLQQDGSSYS